MLYRYCGPRWTASAGAVILQRNDMPERDLVAGVDGSILMTTADADVDWGTGPRLEIARYFDSGWDFEIEYFGIDNFSQSAEAQNGTPLVQQAPWKQFVFNDLKGTYTNDLYSLELNLRWPLGDSCRWKGLAGFRCIELQEAAIAEVTLVHEPYVFANRGQLDLDNHLYGFQLGAEGPLFETCWGFSIEGFARGVSTVTTPTGHSLPAAI